MNIKKAYMQVCCGVAALLMSNGAWALKTKINGNDVEVKDNDIFALVMNIGGYVVSFIFGCLSIYALINTIHTTWQKWGDWHNGKAELKELVLPLGIGGSLCILTFAVSAYTITSFTNFFA